MIWPFKRRPTPSKTMLVHGFEPCGDTLAYERFWLLVEYENGARTIECFNGAILPISDGMDMSIPPRVRAWELGEPMARPLIVDLTKLDRALEKAVQNG